ncbi:uncharacterized protein VP01_3501g1, partial [Puccinia sorghi]
TNLHGYLHQALNTKVNLFMEAHGHQLPSTQDILRFLDAARTKQHLAKSSRSSETSSLQTSLASQEHSSTSNPSDQAEMEFNAMTKTTQCYICKKPDHLAPNCLHKKCGVPAPTVLQIHSPMSYLPCLITYNYDNTLYVRPLQPEPGRTPSIHANFPNPTRHPRANPIRSPIGVKQIDSNLFTEEPEESLVFENKNLSLEPTFKRFDVREISTDNSGQDTIWDSGAKDNVTGDSTSTYQGFITQPCSPFSSLYRLSFSLH